MRSFASSNHALIDFYNQDPPIAPNLFLIGAMRAGSTSLHNLLSQHPDIYMSEIKEPMFFRAESLRKYSAGQSQDSDSKTRMAAEQFESDGRFRKIDDYKTLFSNAEKFSWRGESSHYLYHPDTACSIHDCEPNAHILVILRNPVDRLFSEYLLQQRTGRFDADFEQFVWPQVEGENGENKCRNIPGSRISKGYYSRLLEPWVECFENSQVMVILFDDFCENPMAVCDSVFSWLGIEKSIELRKIHAQRSGIPKFKGLSNWFRKKSSLRKILAKTLPRHLKIFLRDTVYKATLVRPEMSPGTRQELINIYRADIESLETLLDVNLAHWKN